MNPHPPDDRYSIAELYAYCKAHGYSEAKRLEHYLAETPTKRPTRAWAEAVASAGATARFVQAD